MRATILLATLVMCVNTLSADEPQPSVGKVQAKKPLHKRAMPSLTLPRLSIPTVAAPKVGIPRLIPTSSRGGAARRGGMGKWWQGVTRDTKRAWQRTTGWFRLTGNPGAEGGQLSAKSQGRSRAPTSDGVRDFLRQPRPELNP